jgi:predicted dehydrogenase
MVTIDSHSQIRILVIGAGSIGKRHAGNLASLGVPTDIFDVNLDLARKISLETGSTLVTDLDRALRDGNYQAAIVCTPNHLHIPVANKVADASVNLFIEKPLSHTFEGVDSLVTKVKENDLIGMAGFNLRYEPGLQFIKNSLKPEEVAFARIEFGSYLPSWRPESDYRKTYSANRSMGGGIILDDVHELDYACWLFGYPEQVGCSLGRFGNLEIDVEDTAEFFLTYKDKLVTVHCDYLQRKYTRTCKICCKNGDTIEWVFGESVTVHSDTRGTVFSYYDRFKTNDMYLAEMSEFLECLIKKRTPHSDLENAARILDIALNAKGANS